MSTSLQKPKATERRKHVCRCKTYDCHLGVHLDANGVSQVGVELTPTAYESHQRAEKRRLARTKRNSNLSAAGRPHNSEDPNGTLTPLISQLNLNTRNPRGDSENQPDPLSRPHAWPTTPSPVDHTEPGIDSVNDPSVCAAALFAHQSGMESYDCEKFYKSNFKEVNVLILNAALSTAIMSVFAHSSMATSSWLLDVQRITIKLALTHGLLPKSTPAHILPSEEKVLDRIPQTVTTVFRWLDIDPTLIFMNCCQACFALYPLIGTPSRCLHRISRIPGGPPGPEDPDLEVSVTTESNHSPDFSETICGQPLLKYSRMKEVPIRQYAFQDLSEWISRLLSRPSVEELLDGSLEESSKPFRPQEVVHNVYQSRLWKEFKGPDGKQFTSTSGNLLFGMFVDGINPFGNKQSGHHASITFVVLVCLTLPFRVRFLPENIFLAGVAPGPREPSLEQMNWILRPVVTQLQRLWSPSLLVSQTHSYKDGRLIKAALLPFIADIPAIRRSLGFPSATATYFCSFCLLKKSDINNFDPKTWPSRTCKQHKTWAYEARDSTTVKEREEIFKTHGVRYSVLVELEYWDITKYHVLDSMHNLLLGLLAWHCRRFWSMQEIENEEYQPVPIYTKELLELISEHSKPRPQRETTDDIPKDQVTTKRFIDEVYSENTSSSDHDFDPFHDAGWNGDWAAPPFDEVIFDSHMLDIINAMLPRIRIPSWIKRAIPVLGKASFGKLKADEWRNLFTIQLPLLLIPIWYGKDHIKTSLLKNFCHLVSLVNLALKREMTVDTIQAYNNHIQEYLKSCIILFQHCKLAPNHHAAIHLSECLEAFGPVRAWWSFPFERLMGGILKGCHNNHMGELEISFVKNYCRAGNISAFLKSDRLPEGLRPFATRLQALYESDKTPRKRVSNSKLVPLDNFVLELLVKRLNEQHLEECIWVTPENFALLSETDGLGYGVVPPRGILQKRVDHKGVSFSQFSESQIDSFIMFNSRSTGTHCFGRITTIFVHRRTPEPSNNIIDTWLLVQAFTSLPAPLQEYNPFSRIAMPAIQASLQLWHPTQNVIIRLDEVVAHCAWIMYKPGELHKKLNSPTVALICMDRDQVQSP